MALRLRPAGVVALILVAFVLATAGVLVFRPKPPPPVVPGPATRVAATVPAPKPATTQAARPPALTYVDLVRKAYPALPATQPFIVPVDLKHAGHFILSDPVYLDAQAHLWITRADAEPTDEVLARTPDQQVHLVRERVVFVHWYLDDSHKWAACLVVRDGEGLAIVSLAGRQKLALPEAGEWARAFSWYDGPDSGKIVVPTSSGVVIVDPSGDPKVWPSPPLAADGAGHAHVQALLDWRGVLAWIPEENGQPGSRGVVRFAGGQWQSLGADKGWPGRFIHLVPLLDGSVLQIMAGDNNTVSFGLAAVDPPKVDEPAVLALIAKLSDDDPIVRDAAYKKLTQYGPAMWPIAERVMDDQIAEARVRLKDLLRSKVAPTLGGMSLVEPRMRVIGRDAARGVVFYAEKGVSIPRGDDPPQIVAPAWITICPGEPVRLPDMNLRRSLDPAKERPVRIPGGPEPEWIVLNAEYGPQRALGSQLDPVLRKDERAFSEAIGIDRRGRWLFRRPGQADAGPTLILDPTLPDATPHLPVWLLHSDDEVVGWDKDNWPVRKSGSAYALERDHWRPMRDDEKVFTRRDEIPPQPPPASTTAPAAGPTTIAATSPATTQPLAATEPAEEPGQPILVGVDGSRYYDGQKALRVVRRDGSRINWDLPASAQGDQEPALVQTDDGRLYLLNQRGHALRLRATGGEGEPFVVEATFTHRIPSSTDIARIWLDPAGRINIAYQRNRLAVLFPQGYIPPPIWLLMPADEQDAQDEEGN